MAEVGGTPALTVAELIERLQTLPPETPIHHKGNMGDFPVGISPAYVSLRCHKKEEYWAYSEDEVWAKKWNLFSEPVKALVFL